MTKEEYINLIKKEKHNFDIKYSELQKMYEICLKKYEKNDMKEIMLKHNKLLKETVLNLLRYYPEFQEVKSMIIFTGSIARNTNLLYSDIDINIIYDNKYREKLLQQEDKFCYMLSIILGFRGRDRIHGITYYLPKISNVYNNEIKNNSYKLEFSDGVIEYKCRDNADKTMWNTFNSTRSIDDLTNYMLDNSKLFEDWTNCYSLIIDNGYYNKFHSEIKKNELNNIKKEDFLESIHKLKLDIKEKLNTKDIMTIRDIKLIYKNRQLHLFYKLLAIIYKILLMNGIEIDKIDLKQFDDSNILLKLNIKSNIFDYGYHYLFMITRLQYIINCLNLDLSKHSLLTIEKDKLNIIYKEKLGGNDIFDDLNKVKNILNDEILTILDKLEELI